MTRKKYLTYICFALKARQCGVGASACEANLLKRKTKVLICSLQASERTINKFRKLCEEQGVPFFSVEDDLGAETGREGANIFSVNDVNLADAIIKELNMNTTFGGQ